ncbi:hypothetical protein ACTA71_003877 [Dictyostelium dimigraforme]
MINNIDFINETQGNNNENQIKEKEIDRNENGNGNQVISEQSEIKEGNTTNDVKIQKQLNILVLGGTGVGKSTFLNSIINYLRFNTLADALACENREILYTIPVNVNIWVNDDKCINFDVGRISDQKKVGVSDTKFCSTYPIHLPDGLIINFTDTPGVGDTNGASQDNKNFENILDELAEIKVLHGIVVLLDPKESRLTTSFKYCINELFTRLHASARNNLFFVFTKTRGEMFKPGSGLRILKEHLSKLKESSKSTEISTDNRYFCVDNEAFSYLMAKKFRNETFEEGDEECYSSSWIKSTQAMVKLVQAISKVEPHRVSESICINSARHMITKTIYPLRQCIDSIERKEKEIKQLNEELENNQKNVEKLQDLLFIKTQTYEDLPLPNPFIFCNHDHCKSRYSKYNDVTLMGHLCDCKDLKVTKESWIYFRGLINLLGKCKNCGHSYSFHKVEINSKIQKEEILENVEVKKEMNYKKEEILTLKDQTIKNNSIELENLKYEKTTLDNALLKFSIFLNHHSLVPINYDYREYIDQEMKIKEQEKGKNEEALENLKRLLDEYNNYKSQISSNQGEPGNVPSADSIFSIVQDIEKLGITSGHLKRAINIQTSIQIEPKREKKYIYINKLSKIVSNLPLAFK